MKRYVKEQLVQLDDLSATGFFCITKHTHEAIYISNILRNDLSYSYEKDVPIHSILKEVSQAKKNHKDTICLEDKDDHQHFYRFTEQTILLDNEPSIVYHLIDIQAQVDLAAKYEKCSIQNKLRTNKVPCGFFCFEIIEQHLSISYCNTYFYQSLGYQEIDKSALLSDNIMHPEDKKPFQQNVLLHANRKDAQFEIEFRVYDNQHTLHWMLARFVPDVLEHNYLAAIIDVTERKEIIHRLQISEEEKHIALQQGNLMILRYHIKEKILYLTDEGKISNEKHKILENVPDTVIGKNIITEGTLEDFMQFYYDMQKGIPKGSAIFQQMDFHLNEYRWIKAKYSLLYSENYEPTTAIISYEDYTDTHDKELAYERWKQEFENKKSQSIAYYEYDLTNDKFENLEGELEKHLPARERRSFTNIAHYVAIHMVIEKDRKKYLKVFSRERLLEQYKKGVHQISLQHRRYNSQGEEFWCLGEITLILDPYAAVVKASVLLYDIDDQKKNTIRLKKLSETDSLTGLLNRATFIQKVNNSLYHSGYQVQHVLVIVDLDHFKELNDTYGHQYGDKALIQVAKKLKQVCRGEDMCARLGGDEFILFFRNLSLQSDISYKLKEILKVLHSPQDDIQISASLGAACYPVHGTSFAVLYEKADHAMYHAKNTGRNQFCIYEKAIDADSEK